MRRRQHPPDYRPERALSNDVVFSLAMIALTFVFLLRSLENLDELEERISAERRRRLEAEKTRDNAKSSMDGALDKISELSTRIEQLERPAGGD